MLRIIASRDFDPFETGLDQSRPVVEMDIVKDFARGAGWIVVVTERVYDEAGEEDVDRQQVDQFLLEGGGDDGDAALIARAFARLLRERGLDPMLPTHREG